MHIPGRRKRLSGMCIWLAFCFVRDSENRKVDTVREGLEPFAYLSFVLDELRYLGKTTPAAELNALLPWAPGIQAKFAV